VRSCITVTFRYLHHLLCINCQMCISPPHTFALFRQLCICLTRPLGRSWESHCDTRSVIVCTCTAHTLTTDFWHYTQEHESHCGFKFYSLHTYLSTHMYNSHTHSHTLTHAQQTHNTHNTHTNAHAVGHCLTGPEPCWPHPPATPSPPGQEP